MINADKAARIIVKTSDVTLCPFEGSFALPTSAESLLGLFGLQITKSC